MLTTPSRSHPINRFAPPRRPLSLDDVLQHLLVEREIGDDPLQLAVLLLQLLQPLNFRRHQPTELLAPDVIGPFANPRLPATPSARRSFPPLPQHESDLLL